MNISNATMAQIHSVREAVRHVHPDLRSRDLSLGCRRETSIVQKRSLDHRVNTDLQLLLNESHRYVGDMLVKIGDQQQASEHYRRQLALTGTMLKSDPTNAQFAGNHAVALIKIADVEMHSGQVVKAISN